MTSYRLIDFANRDRAEVMRFMFSLSKTEFEDVKYELPSAEWDEYKKTTHLGELPILEIDGIHLSTEKTILGYLAREFGYYGESNWECTLIDCIIDACSEIHESSNTIFHITGQDKQEMITYFKDHTFPQILDVISKLVIEHNTSHGFLVADKLTSADMVVSYSIELAKAVTIQDTEVILKNYPVLKEWKAALEDASPQIADWVDHLFSIFVLQDKTDVNKPTKSPSKCAML